MRILYFALALFLLQFTGCVEQNFSNPLPSWNETQNKEAIIAFVEKVTNPNSDSFVPVAERIAVFDNDGTLWSEQPMYFQLYFAFNEVLKKFPQHPEWKEEEPFKSIIEGDIEKALSFGEEGLVKIIVVTHGNISTDDFAYDVKEWAAKAIHPRFNKPFTSLVYQPMLELLEYLRANDFQTFIVSGGFLEFMRPLTEELYGIAPEQVIGSSLKTKFDLADGSPQIIQLPEINFIDDKEGKPIGINNYIGRKPIAAFGNSDGDLQMLQWAASNEKARFMMYIHHTDAEREWAYDRESHIGKLDIGLNEAEEKGWNVVDMKNDWKVIYPFNLGTE